MDDVLRRYLAARLARLREDARRDGMSPGRTGGGAAPPRVDAMEYADAIALAGYIRRAGYEVEALSCREDGRRVGWYILFRGGAYDSRVYRVSSPAEWERWLGAH